MDGVRVETGSPARILVALAGVVGCAVALERLYQRRLREWVLTWGAAAEEVARPDPGTSCFRMAINAVGK